MITIGVTVFLGAVVGVVMFILLQAIACLRQPLDCVRFWFVFFWLTIGVVDDDRLEISFSWRNGDFND